jgi:two-component sensor histidine kinase
VSAMNQPDEQSDAAHGEEARLGALAEYGILDTAPEQGFDDVVLLATQTCGTPVALVSLVDRERQWFKARLGFGPHETDLGRSVCSHAIGRTDLLVIPDLTLDARTRNNPLVTGEPHIRFYAGAPLTTSDGATLGTLCVIDHEPRPEGLTCAQAEGLRALARQVMTLLSMRHAVVQREAMLVELRVAQQAISQERRRLEEMFRQAPSFMALVRGPEHIFELTNPAYMRLVGNRDILGRSVVEALPDAAAQGFVDLLDRVYQTGEPFTTKGYLYAVQPVPGGDSYDRYLDFVYQPTRDAAGKVDGIFVEGYDVTDQVIDAKRRGALAELGDRLRDQADAAIIVRSAAECLAIGLGAQRTGFGTVSIDNETVLVQPDWCAPGVASVAGLHSFRSFGSYVENLKRGETVAIDDVATDERTADSVEAFAVIKTRSLLNLPVLEGGRLVLIVFAHQGQPRAWSDDELQFVRQIGDRTRSAIARSASEKQQGILNQEISHRLKNTLAMVQAIASQTLRQVAERDAVEALNQRIGALARAHEILLHQNWVDAQMVDVTNAVLAAFEDGRRFRVVGPDILLGPRATLSYSLLLHEMATNALKYGALSVPDGHVDIRWRVLGDGPDAELDLTWNEAGGPPAAAPTGRGFGSRLIRMGLVGTGGVELGYLPSGLTAQMRATLSQMQQS